MSSELALEINWEYPIFRPYVIIPIRLQESLTLKNKVGAGAIAGILVVVVVVLGLIAYQVFFAKPNAPDAPPIAKEIPQPMGGAATPGSASGEMPPVGK